jgi:hypothetical protein
VKKTYSIILAFAILFLPFNAEAAICSPDGLHCNWITNSTFASSGTGWTAIGTPTYPLEASCFSSRVAELEGGDGIEQTFSVTGTWTSFTVELLPILLNDTNNFYDELKIQVTNTGTGVTETKYIRGNSFSTTCNTSVLNLSNNYSNATVRVRVTVGGFATGVYQIDNLSFWSHN